MSMQKSNLFGTPNFDKEFQNLIDKSAVKYIKDVEDSGVPLTDRLLEIIHIVQTYADRAESLMRVTMKDKLSMALSFKRLHLTLGCMAFEIQLLADVHNDPAMPITVDEKMEHELIYPIFFDLREFHLQMRETNAESLKYLDPVLERMENALIQLTALNKSFDFNNKIRGYYFKSLPRN